jgi:glycosyltransferase involved in cell wall biosynthesis
MNMKRVLIFSLAYFPKHVGGAEVAIKEITDRVDSSDIEFHMVTNRFDSTLPKYEKVGNVHVHRIGITTMNPTMADLKTWPLNLNKALFQFSAAWKALSLHRQYHFDATWAMMAHSCGVPAALFKIAHPSIPFILTLQEGDPIEYIEKKMRPLWPLFSRAFTTADTIQAISTFLGTWARARSFQGRLEIIPNAVNTAHFSQEYPERAIAEVKDALNKKMGDVFVITTSRLVPKNAVDDMIRALPLLPHNVSFVVLGTGPDEAMLKTLATDIGVSERVKWVGQIGHADMPQYLKACDIFIRASRSEGMGNSFVEAMAAGLPVIATQEGGIADFLFDEKRNPDVPITGWAVDKDSPAQIAAAVQDIMSRPEKVRAVIATAKEMVLEKYDWDLIARDMRERVFMPLLVPKKK